MLIVAVLFGAAFVRGFKEAARQGRTGSDTTVVTSGVGDTTASGKPADAGTTGGESVGKPGDETTPSETAPGEENLPEIRPVTDSTF